MIAPGTAPMKTKLPTQLSCDLLVIGSGASGLSAAVTAAFHGLKVILVEKDPVFGGATAWLDVGAWPSVPASMRTRSSRGPT
jgi:succinate dehydrogenase/fumarate reductase flavoprotein subunit